MKLSTLLILAMGGFIAYLLLHPVAPPAIPAPAAPAVTPPPETARGELIAEALKSSARFEFLHAAITQHLGDGHLLVHGSVKEAGTHVAEPMDIALLGYPRAENYPDGAPVAGLFCVLGTYRYAAVDGSNRTIYEGVFTDHDLAASQPPRPGDWRWKKGALDNGGRR